jgi:hypothetical protein
VAGDGFFGISIFFSFSPGMVFSRDFLKSSGIMRTLNDSHGLLPYNNYAPIFRSECPKTGFLMTCPDLPCIDLPAIHGFFHGHDLIPGRPTWSSAGAGKVYYLITYDPSIHVISGHYRL